MSVLNIRKYPEKVLMEKAQPVDAIDDDLQQLIDSMVETMHAAPGVGLAAPQVGVPKRLAVIDTAAGDSESELLVIINPVIVRKEGDIEFEEGCLSIPEYTTKTHRAEIVLVSALDREGRPVEIHGEGLLSIALQHEIDHLDGILILDRTSPIKREFFKKRFRKSRKLSK
ncbi:MAG: peptide deformylase [Nitrospirota bacterium]|nr:peptide deformylase [Nitrospirota bacterium]